MGILNDIWEGRIAPSHRKSTSEEEKLNNLILKKQEELTPMLSPEARKLFDELMDCQGELASLNDREIFADGFRMGARITLEATGTANGSD